MHIRDKPCPPEARNCPGCHPRESRLPQGALCGVKLIQEKMWSSLTYGQGQGSLLSKREQVRGEAIAKPSSSPAPSFRIQLLLFPREEDLPLAHEPTTVWAESRRVHNAGRGGVYENWWDLPPVNVLLLWGWILKRHSLALSAPCKMDSGLGTSLSILDQVKLLPPWCDLKAVNQAMALLQSQRTAGQEGQQQRWIENKIRREMAPLAL